MHILQSTIGRQQHSAGTTALTLYYVLIVYQDPTDLENYLTKNQNHKNYKN